MGKAVARIICGQRVPYQTPLFFNSAKFFNIEYQTYGTVTPQLPEGISTIHWSHPDGTQLLRINYKSDSREVVGFNAMGLRLRHVTCEKWILTGATLDHVLEHLEEADFDPEFYRRHMDAKRAALTPA